VSSVAWIASLVLLKAEMAKYGRYTVVVPVYWLLAVATGTIELFHHAQVVALAQEQQGEGATVEQKVALGVFAARYLFVLVLAVVGVMWMWTLRRAAALAQQPYAYQPIPGEESIQGNGDAKPTATRSATATTSTGAQKEQPSPWADMYTKLAKLFPFVWPADDRKLQFYAMLSFLLLLAVRVINVYVPLYQKIVVDALAGESGQVYFPWQDILVYIFLRFLQGGTGGVGLFNNLRTLLWIRVEQYTTREISVTTFSHLHKLSLRYHLQRKTGEVLRVIDRGTASITALLSAILFNIVPTVLDIGIAVVYFAVDFHLFALFKSYICACRWHLTFILASSCLFPWWAT